MAAKQQTLNHPGWRRKIDLSPSVISYGLFQGSTSVVVYTHSSNIYQNCLLQFALPSAFYLFRPS